MWNISETLWKPFQNSTKTKQNEPTPHHASEVAMVSVIRQKRIRFFVEKVSKLGRLHHPWRWFSLN